MKGWGGKAFSLNERLAYIFGKDHEKSKRTFTPVKLVALNLMLVKVVKMSMTWHR